MTLDRDVRNQLFEKTVKSKTVLSFGYLSFYKLFCYRNLKYLFMCGCCAPACLKRRAQTQRKHLNRSVNAKTKLK